MRVAPILIAGWALATSAPSVAATYRYAGTIAGTEGAESYAGRVDPPLGAGRYRVSIAVSDPVFLDIFAYLREHYDGYIDGQPAYGQNNVFPIGGGSGGTPRGETFVFEVPQDYVTYTPWGALDREYHYNFEGVTFEFDTPIGDRVSYRLSIAAVPEPASWALMILGFGGVGAAMRRRRSVPDRGRAAPARRLHAPRTNKRLLALNR